MIEINLLPEELRLKRQSSKPSQLDNLVYLIPVILFVVVVVHMYLGMIFLTRSKVLAGLESTWHKLEPKRVEVLGLKSEINSESTDAQMVQSYLAKRVPLAPKLNKLSLDLPPGIWFNSINN